MKTTLVIVAISAVILLSSFLPGEGATKYLTVRSIEFYGGIFDSKIVVVDEKGSIEEYELEKMRSKTLGENAKRINKVLNDLSMNGYELINCSAAGFGTDGLVNLYLFRKK
jgi:hypothetical protein